MTTIRNGTTATIRSLGWTADTSYQVYGCGRRTVRGTALVARGNRLDQQGGQRRALVRQHRPPSRAVAENTPGARTSAPVTATDANSTTLTYSLEGPDAGLFDFDSVDRADTDEERRGLNHEDPAVSAITKRPAPTWCWWWWTMTTCGYDVTVTCRRGGRKPTRPAAPTVERTERTIRPPTFRRRIEHEPDVSWTEPRTQGPQSPTTTWSTGRARSGTF